MRPTPSLLELAVEAANFIFKKWFRIIEKCQIHATRTECRDHILALSVCKGKRALNGHIPICTQFSKDMNDIFSANLNRAHSHFLQYFGAHMNILIFILSNSLIK